MQSCAQSRLPVSGECSGCHHEKSASATLVHERIHSGEKPFKCKLTIMNERLQKYLRHHKEKELQHEKFMKFSYEQQRVKTVQLHTQVSTIKFSG